MSRISNYFTLMFIVLSFQLVAQKQKKPNIVWITSEDNSVHYMKLYNKNGVETPNIEALATEGLIFNHAFSNAPVCSAARSTIISGCYGPRIGSHYHRRYKKVPMPEGLNMFPVYLKEAGYYTTNNSKEDYNIIKSPNVWDQSSKKASWRNRQPDQPFFHVQNFMTTHESRLHFPENEINTHKTAFNMDQVNVQPNHPDTKLFKYSGARYRDQISIMDKELGEIVAKLKEDKLMDDTFIFYYGDHGGVLPGSKGYIYETGLHVPLVVYVPKNYRHLVDFEPSARVDGFVNFIDLAPTVLNLAGIEIPKGIDGVPFLGDGVDGKEMNSRDFTYGYADRFDEKYDMVRTIRKGKYKYMRSYQPMNIDGLYNKYRYKQAAYREWKDLYTNCKLDETQAGFFHSRQPEMLFDVESDPYEVIDLSKDKKYAKKLNELRALLDKQEKDMPDIAFIPEYILIQEAFTNPTKYGQEHKQEIMKYKSVADLQLKKFERASSALKKALQAQDAWERYWGIMVCLTFGEEASVFEKELLKISKNDSTLINRVLAAEYLSLFKNVDPTEVMRNALYSCKNEAEGLLILNSMALMKDVKGLDISINTEQLVFKYGSKSFVNDRLHYLNN